MAAAWKRGEKKDCKLSVAEGLKPVAVKESPLKASLSAEKSRLGDALRQHILSSDKSDADSSEPDILLEVDHLPVRGVTSDCEPGSSAGSAVDPPPAKRPRRSRHGQKDGKLEPVPQATRVVNFETKLVAIAGSDYGWV